MSQVLELSTIPKEKLECNICGDVLIDPISFTCCGNNICRECPTGLDECPHCRTKLKLQTTKGHPNSLLTFLIESLYGKEWLEQERVLRSGRQAEAKRVRKIEDAYLSSRRHKLLQETLTTIFQPSGVVFDLSETLQKSATLQELLPPDHSPISETEMLYHLDQISSDCIRVGRKLISINSDIDFCLKGLPLSECLINVVPLLLKRLKDGNELDLERFLIANKELLGLQEPVTISEGTLSSFCHLLQDKDVQKEKKVGTTFKAKAKGAAAKSAPRVVPLRIIASEEEVELSDNETSSTE